MAKTYRGVVVTLAYVQPIENRYGRVYYYFRREGRRLPLPGKPGSPDFMLAYNAAIAGFQVQQKPSRSPPGSVSAAIAEYYRDNSFLGMAAGTRRLRRSILERFRREFGDLRLSDLDQGALTLLLGKRRPFAARNWLTALRGLLAWAVSTGLRDDNPAETIRPNKAKIRGHHTWTEDEIGIFERHHAVGTRARLAMALLLFTAARRGDAVALGPQHIRAGRIVYRQQKTGRALAIPVHPHLAAIIEATPSSHLTFLATAHGAAFTPGGFGAWFRKVCNEAGLPQCSAHGLRKAQARRLAEAGCTAHEIASITGHKTLAEVQRYTDAVEQSGLAERAIRTVSRTPIGNRSD
jgi:integrase